MPTPRDFTAGTIACRPADQKPWKISHQGRRASGTASLTQYANGSFSVYRLLKAASSIVCTPPRKHCRFHPFGRAVVT